MMGQMGGQQQEEAPPEQGPAPGGGGGQPPQAISEAPLGGNVPAYEEPIGGAPPIPPLEQMADM